MNIRRTYLGAFGALVFAASVPVWSVAQEPNPTSGVTPGQVAGQITQQQDGIFLYRVKVVQRDLDAVNYFHRSGSTRIGFKGTVLLPGASGEAKVTSERGQISIDAKFQGLTPANGFGPEYLTYVLWAISPDGRPSNLGEVLPAGTKNNINVTTSLQSFGLIVTAEPYFSVTQPSDVVVLQNVILEDKTQGVLEKVNAHYSLLPRGFYAETEGSKTVADPITRNERSPLELFEAYNAMRIATLSGADRYAPDIMAQAKQDLRNAADLDGNKHGDRKLEITYARQAVQRAEDARLVSLRKQAAERQVASDRARQQAQMQAEQSQMQAQQSQMQAEASQLQAAQAQAAADRAAAETARAEAERLRAQSEANSARNQAAQSAAEVTATRERLREQLNKVLQTTETARGLIVNLSDVLFDTGRYTLKPDTKLSLAKVAVILQAYPSLKLQVEGYTDSVGSDELNQKLSENRANTVKDFLISQGTDPASISAAGYGKSNPVADNSTAAGRAQNRRVDLIVSGAAIGVTQSGPSATSGGSNPQ